MTKKINIAIDGMHCRSCKTLIESDVEDLKGVKKINVDYQTGKCNLEFDEERTSEKEIFKTIENLNYKVVGSRGGEKSKEKRNKFDLKKLLMPGVLLLLFFITYYLIKSSGSMEILAKLNESNLSYSLIFIIGILASFHCVGMCGGLVVTYTAGYEAQKEKRKIKSNVHAPHFQYNLGRLVSYTIVGGLLGGLGSFFGVNPTFTGVVTLVAGGLMILMGLSLLTNFTWLKKIKIKTPDSIAKFLYNNRKSDKPKGPLVIGLLTGFMPCGPLQAMQLYALASGSFISGALSMGIYALGTIPLMFGFGSFLSLISKNRIKQIIKLSGLVVIVLGIFMINRGLVNFGYGDRNFSDQDNAVVVESNDDVQLIEMDVTYSGYKPNVLYIKKGVPVKWIIRDKGITGCTNEIFLYHEDGTIKQKLNQKGDTVIEFTPTKLGELKFSCWMQMVWGKFIVTEDGSQAKAGSAVPEVQAAAVPQSGGCGGDCGGGCAGERSATCGCGGQ
jgi:uncharacterized protein